MTDVIIRVRQRGRHQEWRGPALRSQFCLILNDKCTKPNQARLSQAKPQTRQGRERVHPFIYFSVWDRWTTQFGPHTSKSGRTQSQPTRTSVGSRDNPAHLTLWVVLHSISSRLVSSRLSIKRSMYFLKCKAQWLPNLRSLQPSSPELPPSLLSPLSSLSSAFPCPLSSHTHTYTLLVYNLPAYTLPTLPINCCLYRAAHLPILKPRKPKPLMIEGGRERGVVTQEALAWLRCSERSHCTTI